MNKCGNFCTSRINCSICSSVNMVFNAAISVSMQRCDQGIFLTFFRTRWCDHVGEIKIADLTITLYRWAFLAGIEMISVQAVLAKVVSLVSLVGKSVSATFLAEISETLAMNKREKNRRGDFSLRDNRCDCPPGSSSRRKSWFLNALYNFVLSYVDPLPGCPPDLVFPLLHSHW